MANVTDEKDKNSIDRVICVFVSSTFDDMKAEREELVKRVFPEPRRRCDSRGVVWSEVDLRWGVTDEQKAEGKVLPREEPMNLRRPLLATKAAKRETKRRKEETSSAPGTKAKTPRRL